VPLLPIFFYNEPKLGAGIDPGMALTPFPSSILDEIRFKPFDQKLSTLTTKLG